MICHNCQQAVLPEDRFCGSCGSPVTPRQSRTRSPHTDPAISPAVGSSSSDLGRQLVSCLVSWAFVIISVTVFWASTELLPILVPEEILTFNAFWMAVAGIGGCGVGLLTSIVFRITSGRNLTELHLLVGFGLLTGITFASLLGTLAGHVVLLMMWGDSFAQLENYFYDFGLDYLFVGALTPIFALFGLLLLSAFPTRAQ